MKGPDEATIAVIIPALNEEQSIEKVVTELPEWVHQIIVVDNGSTDKTAERARNAGAIVVSEPIKGYGRACLAGIAAAKSDIIVFMDADAADDPADLPALLAPLLNDTADFVIGSRLSGFVEPGALTLTQRFGNQLACKLMGIFWNGQFTDLGPFRAIRSHDLQKLQLNALTYGWTVQMQVRCLKAGLRSIEVPVHYRRRIGTSKISGTFKGVVLAGFYILSTIGVEAIQRKKPKNP